MPAHIAPPQSYDVLGIGFGPSNLALAIALRESGSNLSFYFTEAAPRGCWHPGMLLDGSDIQHNPLRDLVTPRNPQSYFSFVNYLKSQNKIFEYLNLGLSYPFRKEYARYISWATGFFNEDVGFARPVTSVRYDDRAHQWQVDTPSGPISARSLVVGTGRSRNIPEPFKGAVGPRVFHLCDYLHSVENLRDELQSIAVVGASQSAVEINLDLLNRFPSIRIHAIHRSFAMGQKDTSPFSDHIYFPEFTDFYYNASKSTQEDLRRQLRRTNYGAADLDVLRSLYVRLYEERLDGRERFLIHNNTAIIAAKAGQRGVDLTLTNRINGAEVDLCVDAVVLATGFKDIGVGEGYEPSPPLLADVLGFLNRDDSGCLKVRRDYTVHRDVVAPCYLNGLCESSHGFGDAGSFSLLALRAAHIVESLEARLNLESPRNQKALHPARRFARQAETAPAADHQVAIG